MRVDAVRDESTPTVDFPDPDSPNNLLEVVSRTTQSGLLYHARDKCLVSHAKDERNVRGSRWLVTTTWQAEKPWQWKAV
jgi:hypothetical protein